mmetsp:Transcript_5084/g.14857  ORF Transcript_5084/g.14857 Transcript_5084/m.14857 type:complete len:423 (-) Transcript_5084:35-1303(-)
MNGAYTLLIIFIALLLAVGLHQPNNDRLGIRTKGGALVFVDGIQGVIGTSIFGPLEDGLLLEGILVVHLLQHDGKVLRLVPGNEFQGGDQVALDDLVTVGDGRDGWCVLGDRLVLEEVVVDEGAHQDLDLVVGFERRCHLLVGDGLDDVIVGGVRVVEEELAGSFHGEQHGPFIVNASLGGNRRGIVVVAAAGKNVVLLLAEHGLLDVVLFAVIVVLGGLVLVLGRLLFLLLVLLGLLLVVVTVLLLLALLVALLVLAVLLGLLLGLLVLGEDVVAELVVHVDHLLGPAGGALVPDAIVLDFVLRLGQAAVGAQDEGLDVAVHELLEGVVGVRPVDDGAVRGLVVGGLGAELAAEELVDLARRPVQAEAHVGDVGDGRLDSVSGALNLAEDGRHLVPVLRVVDWAGPSDVDDASSADRHFEL